MYGFDKPYIVSYKGVGIFNGVDFVNAGQWNKGWLNYDEDPRWPIVFRNTINDENIVDRCIFSHTYNNGINVHKSKVSIKWNVFYRASNGAIDVYDSDGSSLSWNLAVNTIHTSTLALEKWNMELTFDSRKFYESVIKVDSQGVSMTDNRISHAMMAGYTHPGMDCDGGNTAYFWGWVRVFANSRTYFDSSTPRIRSHLPSPSPQHSPRRSNRLPLRLRPNQRNLQL